MHNRERPNPALKYRVCGLKKFINRCPCAPLDAGAWPPEEYDRWLDEHWDDPAEKKRLQYRENAIADPKRLPDRWIQACLWTITPHDVVDIRPACGKPDTIGNHG